MSDNIRYSNDDIKILMQNIMRAMALRSIKPELIAAIVRGGLVPGVYLSHYFDVPLLCITVGVDKQPHRNVALHEVADYLKANKNVLLVDEICDTGTTLRNIWDILYNMCPEIEVASKHPYECTIVERYLYSAVLLHNEAEEVFSPDFIGEIINKYEDPSWIVFEWESWWN